MHTMADYVNVIKEVLGMDTVDWVRLAVLHELDLKAICDQKPMLKKDKHEMNVLLDKTMDVDGHPEDWDWGCLCQLCCSYGD